MRSWDIVSYEESNEDQCVRQIWDLLYKDKPLRIKMAVVGMLYMDKEEIAQQAREDFVQLRVHKDHESDTQPH